MYFLRANKSLPYGCVLELGYFEPCHYDSDKLEICHPDPHVSDWWHPPVSEIPMAFQTVKIIMAYFHLTQ
jgi:hypothetical protein